MCNYNEMTVVRTIYKGQKAYLAKCNKCGGDIVFNEFGTEINGHSYGCKRKTVNEILLDIALEYANRFGYTKTSEREINNRLKEVRYEGVGEKVNGLTKRKPSIMVRKRFDNYRIDVYWPKEKNKGYIAFVGLEFNDLGQFSEAQIFYKEGANKFSDFLKEVEERIKKEIDIKATIENS